MRTSTFALVAALAGCQAAADPEPSIAQQVVEVRAHMHVRFAATRRVQQAIGIGDLDRAHAEAKTIADLDEPHVLPAWQPYIDQIRGAARQIVLAKDTVAAARTSAILGRRCAQCHEAAAAKIVFVKDPAPADDPRLAPQMLGHQWAAARLWEGLMGPSNDRWLDGARQLTRARLTIVAEGNLPAALGVSDDVARLRLLATRALTSKTQDDRTTLYGELLGTCARCHFTIRDR